MTNEAFSRVKIDAQLRDQGWDITDTSAVRFEYVLPDRTKADYVLCDCSHRLDSEPPRRLKSEPGLAAGFVVSGCG